MLGSAYLIWLAIKLLDFQYSDNHQNGDAKPFNFWQAFIFQYVNPKAWVMVISANASFSLAGEEYWLSVCFIILVFALVGPPSIMVWAAFGQMIRRFLIRPGFLKVFNSTMAALTASCVVFIWLG